MAKGFSRAIEKAGKHEAIVDALRRRNMSQRDGARLVGMDQWRFGEILAGKAPGRLTITQQRGLLGLTGMLPEELWPKPAIAEEPPAIEALIAHGLLLAPEGPEECLLRDDCRRRIRRRMLRALTPIEEWAIKSRVTGRLTAFAGDWGVSKAGASYHFRRGIRKLLRSSRI